jgi:2-methylcitrate dehydratase PrpD
VQELQKKYVFSSDDVDRIECLVQPVIADCLKYSSPISTLQGKFSINYNIALAALYGTVKLANFDGELITDKKVIDFMPKIKMTIDPVIADGQYSNGKFDSIVKIYLKDGRVLEERTVNVKGDPTNRMSVQETYDKFFDCAKRLLKANEIKPIYDKLANLEKIPTIVELVESIQKAVK